MEAVEKAEASSSSARQELIKAERKVHELHLDYESKKSHLTDEITKFIKKVESSLLSTDHDDISIDDIEYVKTVASNNVKFDGRNYFELFQELKELKKQMKEKRGPNMVKSAAKREGTSS